MSYSHSGRDYWYCKSLTRVEHVTMVTASKSSGKRSIKIISIILTQISEQQLGCHYLLLGFVWVYRTNVTKYEAIVPPTRVAHWQSIVRWDPVMFRVRIGRVRTSKGRPFVFTSEQMCLFYVAPRQNGKRVPLLLSSKWKFAKSIYSVALRQTNRDVIVVKDAC